MQRHVFSSMYHRRELPPDPKTKHDTLQLQPAKSSSNDISINKYLQIVNTMESNLTTPKASDQQKRAEASDQSSLITPKASDQQKRAKSSDQQNKAKASDQVKKAKASDQPKKAKASDQKKRAKASDQQKRAKAHELAVAELHKMTDELAIELHKAAVSILIRALVSGR